MEPPETTPNVVPKQIKVPDEIHDALTKLGTKNETYGQIIKRLIDYWEKGHKRNV